MVTQLSTGGTLNYTHVNPFSEAKLAWNLAGNLMAIRAARQGKDTHSIATREEDPRLASTDVPREWNGLENVRSCNVICNP